MENTNDILKILLGVDESQSNHICDNSCRYYEKAFDHRDKACVLSDVFSVKKGEPCSTYEVQNGRA